MKRLFALFLAITLCTSLSLTSCKKKSDAVDAGAPITLEEVKADPTGAVERSAAEASQVGIFKTFENIGKLENVHVSLDIPNVADVEMWASVAENLKGFAMDLNDKQSDQIISANINQKHAAIGYDGKTYGIPVENLKENFENAKFWEFADMTPEEFYDEIEDELGISLDELATMFSSLGEQLATFESEINEEAEGILAEMEVNVEQLEIETAEGKLDAIVVDYPITTDSLEDICYWYLDVLERNPLIGSASQIIPGSEDEYYDIVDQYEYIFDELIAAFDEYIDSFNIKYLINAANGRLSQFVIEFTSDHMEDPDATYVLEIDLGHDYLTSDTVYINAYTLSDGEKIMDSVIKIAEKLDKKEYSMVITATTYEDGEIEEEIEIFNIEADRKNGRYTVSAMGQAMLAGDFEAKDGLFSISVDGVPLKLSVEYGEKSFELELEAADQSLEFVIDDEKLPETPDYKNIFEMDEDEFEALADLFTFEETAVAEIKQPEIIEDEPVDVVVGEDEPEVVENEISAVMSLEEYANELDRDFRSLVYYDDLSVSIIARDNSIVYQYKYTKDAKIPEDIAEDLETIGDAVLSALEKHRAASNCEIESIIYEYYDGEGELIAGREFK
ncbi:MAG: hypothetical protein E7656_07050 [Ruminococcaceae bacterium]|nr:hypothetical protein [Oscillospiraceae bacterium]